VSDRVTRGRNAIFGHVARLPDNTSAHQALLRQVELSVGRPQTLRGNVHQVDHVRNGPTNSAATTTMFPLRLCGGKLLVAITRERRYGPSRLRVNDDDDDLRIRVSGCCPIKIHSPCLLFFRFDDRFSAAFFLVFLGIYF